VDDWTDESWDETDCDTCGTPWEPEESEDW